MWTEPELVILFERLHPAGPWLWVAVGGGGGAHSWPRGPAWAFYVQSTACKKGEYNAGGRELRARPYVSTARVPAPAGMQVLKVDQKPALEVPAGGEVFAIQLTSA